jgi:hypothetical protein
MTDHRRIIRDRQIVKTYAKLGLVHTEEDWASRVNETARRAEQRAEEAARLASGLMKLDERQIQRQSAFTLRCNGFHLLAMIFPRRVQHPMSPPNNELIICWTRKGWRAELNRWHMSDDPLDRVTALQVACQHGDGRFDLGTISTFVCHAAPESTEPDTWFPLGATRRLGDPMTMTEFIGQERSEWSHPKGDCVADVALGVSWRSRY